MELNVEGNEKRYKIVSISDSDFTMLKAMLSHTSAYPHNYLKELKVQSLVLAENSNTIFIRQSDKTLLKDLTIDK